MPFHMFVFISMATQGPVEGESSEWSRWVFIPIWSLLRSLQVVGQSESWVYSFVGGLVLDNWEILQMWAMFLCFKVEGNFHGSVAALLRRAGLLLTADTENLSNIFDM